MALTSSIYYFIYTINNTNNSNNSNNNSSITNNSTSNNSNSINTRNNHIIICHILTVIGLSLIARSYHYDHNRQIKYIITSIVFLVVSLAWFIVFFLVPTYKATIEKYTSSSDNTLKFNDLVALLGTTTITTTITIIITTTIIYTNTITIYIAFEEMKILCFSLSLVAFYMFIVALLLYINSIEIYSISTHIIAAWGYENAVLR